MPYRTKHILDTKVAHELGIDVETVSKITTRFFQLVRQGVLNQIPINVDGFGTFRGVLHGIPQSSMIKKGRNSATRHQATRGHFHVYFTKAATFTELVRKKYGRGIVGGDPDGEVQRRRGNRSGVAREEGS